MKPCLLFACLVVLVVTCESKRTALVFGNKDSAYLPVISAKDSLIENRIADTICTIKQVQAASKFIDSFSNHQHGVAIVVMERPGKNSDHYTIQAGYDGPYRFEPYYTFYVYMPSMEIKYLDIDAGGDTLILLKDWR